MYILVMLLTAAIIYILVVLLPAAIYTSRWCFCSRIFILMVVLLPKSIHTSWCCYNIVKGYWITCLNICMRVALVTCNRAIFFAISMKTLKN